MKCSIYTLTDICINTSPEETNNGRKTWTQIEEISEYIKKPLKFGAKTHRPKVHNYKRSFASNGPQMGWQ